MARKVLSTKIRFAVIYFAVFTSFLFGQPASLEHIRFPLWADLDAFPEMAYTDLENNAYEYPIQMIKNTAPFIISGMVYGWKYTYTPSDKMRGVEEFFEVEELKPENAEPIKIKYENPWIGDERFHVWVNYTRNENQIQNYKLWASIQNPKIRGMGQGDIRKGFDGIDEAARNAVKDAVRQFYRQEIKNKPKEITGSVLIINPPTIGVQAGKYIIHLDFFMERGTIKEYKTF